MALAVEDVQRIESVDLEPQRGQVNGSRGRPVETAEVDRQPPVDEHPHVVVSREGEPARAVVSKRRVDLGAEVEVVGPILISPSLAIDRKEVVVEIVELVGIVLHERDGLFNRVIDARDRIEPLLESAAGWDEVACRPAGQATALRLAVRAQIVLDQSAQEPIGSAALEVLMRAQKVVVGDVEREHGRERWRRRQGRWRWRQVLEHQDVANLPLRVGGPAARDDGKAAKARAVPAP